MRKLAIDLFFTGLLSITSCGVHKIVVRPEAITTSRIYNWEYCGIHVQTISPYPEPGITSLPMGIRINNNIDQIIAPKVLMYGDINSPPILTAEVPADVHHPFYGEWMVQYERWLWFEVQRRSTDHCYFKVMLKTR